MRTTASGITIRTAITDHVEEIGNAYVSIPEEADATVWRIADWFKVGPRIRVGKSGRMVAKFQDVNLYDIDGLVRYLDRWHAAS